MNRIEKIGIMVYIAGLNFAVPLLTVGFTTWGGLYLLVAMVAAAVFYYKGDK